MRVLVADHGLRIELPRRLATAGWTLSRSVDQTDSAPDLVLVGIELAKDADRVRELRRRFGSSPLVALTRVPLPRPRDVEGDVAALLLPASTEPESVDRPARRPAPRLAVVTTFGPPSGPPGRLHRRALRALRAAGAPASLHGDMQERLASTAAWSTPLIEAMRVAATWGSDLRLMPMLGSLAARAAREQIGLARCAGLRLESRARWLLRTSETLAVEAMNRLAGYAPGSSVAESLPSPAEALVSRAFFRVLRDAYGADTPAADALHALVLGLPSEELRIGGSPGRRGPGSRSE